jgi:glutathione peroxidase
MRWMTFFMLFMSSALATEFYDISEKSIRGEDLKLSEYKGKVVLVVNIASQCGYTGQLEDLEALYKKYSQKNFLILGVPTNDFGGQTPEDDKGMLEFCQRTYNVTFPLLSKKTIVGKDKRELYKYLTEKTSKSFHGEVGWNFEKFLINKEGEVVGRFKSSTKPMDKELIKKIESSFE